MDGGPATSPAKGRMSYEPRAVLSVYDCGAKAFVAGTVEAGEVAPPSKSFSRKDTKKKPHARGVRLRYGLG